MRFPCWSIPWNQLADSPSSGGLLAFSTYYQLGGLEKVLALRAEAESIRLTETSQAVFSKVMDLLITVPPDPECRKLSADHACLRFIEYGFEPDVRKRLYRESFFYL